MTSSVDARSLFGLDSIASVFHRIKTGYSTPVLTSQQTIVPPVVMGSNVDPVIAVSVQRELLEEQAVSDVEVGAAVVNETSTTTSDVDAAVVHETSTTTTDVNATSSTTSDVDAAVVNATSSTTSDVGATSDPTVVERVLHYAEEVAELTAHLIEEKIAAEQDSSYNATIIEVNEKILYTDPITNTTDSATVEFVSSSTSTSNVEVDVLVETDVIDLRDQ